MPNFTRFTRTAYVCLAIIAGSFSLIHPVQAQQPAFPGAEGAGMYTTGGRGTISTPTTVFEVTNLNDDANPGSLRYALATTAAYRTVVFRVSGTIHLNSKLNIRDNTTIAGQTAPGDGICLADYPVVISGNNVVVRYMRFRMGDKNQNKGMVDGAGSDDAFGGTDVSNVIVDHCSVSWSTDECLTIYRGDNLSIQWCFITEPLNYSYHFEAGDTDFEQHGYGGIQGAKRGTIHHNLFADCRNRNPRFAGISTYTPNTVGVENVDFRNNVIYNWGINTVYGGEGGNYNVVNNYYKWGPNTGSGVKYRVCNPSNSSTVDFGKWYVNGNYVDGSTANTSNNWSGVVVGSGPAADSVLAKAITPFDIGYYMNTQSATDAFDSVMANAGAILPRRDTLDQRIVNDVRNRTGRIIDVQGGYAHGTAYSATVNAWPTLTSGTAPTDTDHDGMPDDWETAHGLNPNDASDRNNYDGSGYTMLENYLNNVVNTSPQVQVGGTVKYFSQTAATPSAVQSYTVAGYNLTGNITITPPAAYELSLDGATWYNSSNPIVLTATAGAVSSTSIMVRLNATAQGTYAGNITHVSAGAATTNVAVTGMYTTIAGGLGLGADMDGGFEHQTAGVYTTVTSHISTTQWEASAAYNLVSADTARTGTMFFHFNQASSSNKYIFSPVLSSATLAAATPYVIQFWYRAPSALTAATVLAGWTTVTGSTGGTNSSTTVATATADAALVPGKWYLFTGTLTSPSGTPTSTYAGIKVTNPQIPYFDIDDFVVYPGTAADATAPDAPTSPTASGNANNNTITVNWVAPATGVDGGGYIVVRSTSATVPVPNANGVYIAGNKMGANYKVVYLGANTSFTDTDTALQASAKYYYYIFTADKAYNYCATPVSVTLSIDESGTPAPVVSATGTLAAFTQSVGTPAAAQTITVSGTNLTGNVIITAPANFELSADNGTTWSTSSITLTATNGTVSGTAVAVRLNAAATGAYSGNMVISSADATSLNIAVSGNTVPVGTTPPAGTKLVVAKDGSGNYTSIQAAVNAVPAGQTAPYKIFIRKGKYVETVSIPSTKPFIQLVGESLAETIISYDNYSGKANPAGGTYGTSTCGTVIISAADVMLMNLSVENATGYGVNANAVVPAPGDGPQAVAVYTTSDRVVFYNCRFNGGQDTYYGGNNKATRCYFRNCYIDGNTDFLFGSSTIIFDTCIIYPRTRLDNATGGYVTAVNTKVESLYGYVFRDCKITKNRGYTLYTLGRPWQNDLSTLDAAKSYNKTVFLNTMMGASVKPEGWSTWDAGTNTSFITYAEYNSKKYDGTALDISGRVSWSKQLTAADAAKYYNNDTVFVNANTPAMTTWNPNATWSELNASFKPELAVSNLIAKKGASAGTLTWNLSWPITGVTCELYRSNDKTNFSLISTQVSTEDTACNFNYTDNLPPAGQTWYYIVRTSKSGYTSTTSDTAYITSTPTITATGTLGSFLQGLGTPSNSQSYTVSAINLTNNLVITPPAGFEVSADNTTWYNSTTPLTLAPTSGAITNATISVRLNGTTAGTVSGNIVNASTGASSVNVVVGGTIQTDALKVSVVLQQWPLNISNADSAAVRAAGIMPSTPTFKNLVVSDGVTVAAVPAYSSVHGQAYATTADGYWTTAKGGPGGTLNRNSYEQFTVIAASTHSLRIDSIILSNAFYNTSSNTKLAVSYSVTGFRNDSTDIGVLTRNSVALTAAASGAWSNAFDINNLTAGTTDVYAMLVNGSAGVNLKPGDTLSFRIYNCTGSSSSGRYGKLKNVVVKGAAVPLPAIVIGGTLLAFRQNIGEPSAIQSYTVQGANLTSAITITPPAGYEVSTNGTTWYTASSPLVLTPVSGTVASTTIQVRLNTTVLGTYNGNITHTSTGAAIQNQAVTGFVTLKSVIYATGTLAKFVQNIGVPSAAQTYTLTAGHLATNVTIAPPAGYEVSLDGTTWYNTPLLVVRNADTIVPAPVYVRLNATAVGLYSGNIAHTSTGATTVYIAVTGETLNGPAITATGVLSPFSQTIGKPTNAQSFVVTVNNLLSTYTITPPAGYELSADTGKTWYALSAVPVLPGSVSASRQVMVRLNATTTGSYNGDIAIQSGSTVMPKLPVTGTAYSLYTINPNPAHNYVNIYHAKLYTVATFRIYDISGHIIGDYIGQPATNYTAIDISRLASGMYFVEVIRLEEKVLLRFIKE